MSTKPESEYNIRKNSLSLSLWLSLSVGDLGRRIEKNYWLTYPTWRNCTVHARHVSEAKYFFGEQITHPCGELLEAVAKIFPYEILLCFEGHVLYEGQVGRYKYMSGVWEHAWSCTKLWVPSWRSGAECRVTGTPVGHPPRIWLWNSKSLVFVCE